MRRCGVHGSGDGAAPAALRGQGAGGERERLGSGGTDMMTAARMLREYAECHAFRAAGGMHARNVMTRDDYERANVYLASSVAGSFMPDAGAPTKTIRGAMVPARRNCRSRKAQTMIAVCGGTPNPDMRIYLTQSCKHSHSTRSAPRSSSHRPSGKNREVLPCALSARIHASVERAETVAPVGAHLPPGAVAPSERDFFESDSRTATDAARY